MTSFLSSLVTPVVATWPVTVASAISFKKPNLVLVLSQYVMYSALTSMSATLGSSAVPLCTPSPRSPNQADENALWSSLIRGSELFVTVALPVIDAQFCVELSWKVIWAVLSESRSSATVLVLVSEKGQH